MKKRITALLTALMLFVLCALPSAMADSTGYSRKDYISLDARTDNGRNVGDALFNQEADVIYMQFSDVANLAGVSIRENYSAADGEYAVTAKGLDFSATLGTDYVCVNDRYFYVPGTFLLVSGQPWLEVRTLGRIFGYDVVQSNTDGDVVFYDMGTGILSGGEKYYEETYGRENVKWLSRIIHAETEGDTLACKIGVGNVVMNRISDPYFPNTIHDVIFDVDVNGTVQFSPAETGGLNIPAGEESLLAAYMVLEGASTVGTSEFFVDYTKGDTAWFRKNLTFIVRIGKMDFYADPKMTY